MTRTCLMLAALLFAAGCAGTADTAPPEAPEPTPAVDVGPSEWLPLDPTPLNLRIDQAVADGAGWTASPLRTVLEVFGDDTDLRNMRIEEKKNFGEGATEVTFVVVRDGFLDDSIRGSWTEVVLERGGDQVWRVASGRIAHRCRRASDPDAWTAEPCP